MVLFFCTSFGGDNSQLLYQNFAAAVKNRSNFQYFLVCTIVDVNKNAGREFCTQGFFLRGAIHKERKIDYDNLSEDLVQAIALMYETRFFEFKNQEALDYLNLNLYSEQELKALESRIDFKKLAKQILEAKMWSMKFENDKEMRMYAHALFNQGILTGEDITNEGMLEYVAQ